LDKVKVIYFKYFKWKRRKHFN